MISLHTFPVEGEDFILPDPLETIFAAFATLPGPSACVNITIVNDLVVEGDQTFQLAITGSDPTLSVSQFSSTATVTITDNDGEQLAVVLSGRLSGILRYLSTVPLTCITIISCKRTSTGNITRLDLSFGISTRHDIVYTETLYSNSTRES